MKINKYHVSCFIRTHPPPPSEQETVVWFKQVCDIFKNDVPCSLIEHIVATSLAENNLMLAKLVTTYLELRESVRVRAQVKEQAWNDRYDAYIIRRDTGNVLANGPGRRSLI